MNTQKRVAPDATRRSLRSPFLQFPKRSLIDERTNARIQAHDFKKLIRAIRKRARRN